jgi:hypothetical protein
MVECLSGHLSAMLKPGSSTWRFSSTPIPRRNSARVALMFLDNLAAYADVRCSVDLLPERPRDS